MATTGTTLVAVKEALVAALAARATLTAAVTYSHPGEEGLTGNDVWLADVPTATTRIPTMRAGPKKVHEIYTLQVMIQATRSAGEGQLVADKAAAAHFSEVQEYLATNPQLTTPLIDGLHHVQVTGWAHRTGGFTDGGEASHGSRFELALSVEARLG